MAPVLCTLPVYASCVKFPAVDHQRELQWGVHAQHPALTTPPCQHMHGRHAQLGRRALQI
jgi:hypothetical protein